MPAPRIGPGGVGRLGGALYDELAARELARLKAAAAAEEMRRQLFKEGIETRTAKRADSKQLLDETIEQRQEREWRDKIEHPTPLSVSGALVGGKKTDLFVNPRSMATVGSFESYVPPKDPTWRSGIDLNGVDSDVLVDDKMNVVGSLRKTPQKFAPQQTTWGQPVSVMGPDGPTAMRFSNTGGSMPLPGVELAGTQRPTTVGEYDNFKFYQRMKSGAEIMDAYENQVTDKDWLAIHEMPDWSSTLKTATLSPAAQAWVQGARSFIMAHGRDDSGAAITNTEWRNFKDETVPFSNENQETRRLKKYARDVMQDATGFSAGRAYADYYGSPYVPRGRPPTVYTRGADGKLTTGEPPARGATPPAAPAPRGAAEMPTTNFTRDASGRLVPAK